MVARVGKPDPDFETNAYQTGSFKRSSCSTRISLPVEPRRWNKLHGQGPWCSVSDKKTLCHTRCP